MILPALKCKLYHSQGDGAEKCNYRPISLLPVFSKFIKRTVCDQLTAYLENNNLLVGRQYGFRKKSQLNWHLLIFLMAVFDCIDAYDAGEAVLRCYADLSKAFYCVDGAVLIRKLESLGVENSPLNLLSSDLANRSQVVEIQQGTKTKLQTSTRDQIGIGTRVGSLRDQSSGRCFSWSALTIGIDIVDVVLEIKVFMFADDTTLITKQNSLEALEIEWKSTI